MAGKADDTVLLHPRRRRRWAGLVATTVALAGMVLAAFWFWPQPARQPGQDAGETIGVADEAMIQANVATTLAVFRFSPHPAILVLDFPDLGGQARMLNRVAAWAEKAGQPHDRLLDDAALDAAVAASGVPFDEYYYGHDYRGADLERFFALAERDHVVLRPEEDRLRRLIHQAAAGPAGFGALISIPRASPGTPIDPHVRAVILHHELSHGEYFTNAEYARFVATIWSTVLTAAERDAFRHYLGAEGYDEGLEDVMTNEMQAYLMYTPDPAFFDEARLGIPPVRLAAIRAAFRAGMPPGWLRDATPEISAVSRPY